MEPRVRLASTTGNTFDPSADDGDRYSFPKTLSMLTGETRRRCRFVDWWRRRRGVDPLHSPSMAKALNRSQVRTNSRGETTDIVVIGTNQYIGSVRPSGPRRWEWALDAIHGPWAPADTKEAAIDATLRAQNESEVGPDWWDARARELAQTGGTQYWYDPYGFWGVRSVRQGASLPIDDDATYRENAWFAKDNDDTSGPPEWLTLELRRHAWPEPHVFLRDVPSTSGVSAGENVAESTKYASESGDGQDTLPFLDFNTKLAKQMQRLKKDAGATMVSQNYRGTGSEAARRQLWVRFKSGAVIDIWLERGRVHLGGIVMNAPPGAGLLIAKRDVTYDDKTPEQVYAEVAGVVGPWANQTVSMAGTDANEAQIADHHGYYIVDIRPIAGNQGAVEGPFWLVDDADDALAAKYNTREYQVIDGRFLNDAAFQQSGSVKRAPPRGGVGPKSAREESPQLYLWDIKFAATSDSQPGRVSAEARVKAGDDRDAAVRKAKSELEAAGWRIGELKSAHKQFRVGKAASEEAHAADFYTLKDLLISAKENGALFVKKATDAEADRIDSDLGITHFVYFRREGGWYSRVVFHEQGLAHLGTEEYRVNDWNFKAVPIDKAIANIEPLLYADESSDTPPATDVIEFTSTTECVQFAMKNGATHYFFDAKTETTYLFFPEPLIEGKFRRERVASRFGKFHVTHGDTPAVDFPVDAAPLTETAYANWPNRRGAKTMAAGEVPVIYEGGANEQAVSVGRYIEWSRIDSNKLVGRGSVTGDGYVIEPEYTYVNGQWKTIGFALYRQSQHDSKGRELLRGRSKSIDDRLYAFADDLEAKAAGQPPHRSYEAAEAPRAPTVASIDPGARTIPIPPKPLKWHRDKKPGRMRAEGRVGVYIIAKQKPDRRHGIFPYLVVLNDRPLRSFNDRIEAKMFAEHYDQIMHAQGAPPPAAGTIPASVARWTRAPNGSVAPTIPEQEQQTVPVVRQRPAKVVPLKWHRSKKAGWLYAEVILAVDDAKHKTLDSRMYLIHQQKPDRRHGVLPVVLSVAAHGMKPEAAPVLKMFDTMGQAKRFAEKHNRTAHTSPSQAAEQPAAEGGPPARANEPPGPNEVPWIWPEGTPRENACFPWMRADGTRDPERFGVCAKIAEQIGPIDSPRKVYDLLIGEASLLDQEAFWVVCCDIRGNLRSHRKVALGQRSRVGVGVVDVMRNVLGTGCELFQVVHVHPTGNPKPSPADIRLTKSIDDATKVYGSELTFGGHVVLGSNGRFASISNKGKVEMYVVKDGKTYELRSDGKIGPEA